MRRAYSKIELVLGAVLLITLTGCVDGPQQREVYAAGGGVGLQADYVYYPGYQIYYSSTRRQYLYLESNAWVSRPAPPQVSVDVLLASPSVRLDFHDAPSIHHATVVKQYPKKWKPTGLSPNNGNGDKANGKRNDRGDGR